jgi:hypothetical protein
MIPIALFISNGGSFKWFRQFTQENSYIVSIRFDSTATSIAALINNPSNTLLTIAILSTTDGSVTFSYKDSTTTSGTVIQEGLTIDSNNNIYMAMTTSD